MRLVKRIGGFVMDLPEVSTVVYAAGFYQGGRADELTTHSIEEMISVGSRGLVFLLSRFFDEQNHLSELVTITSTSQWAPRRYESVYDMVKAGVQHFSHAMSKDGRIDKTLVVAPSGMNTEFWEGTDRSDLGTVLDPADVARAIDRVRQLDYTEGYKEVQILCEPLRVNEVLRDGLGNVQVVPPDIDLAG